MNDRDLLLNTIRDIKKQYELLLENDLTNYLISTADEVQANVFADKYNIKLTNDFFLFLINADIKIAIENGYDSMNLTEIDKKLASMNRNFDEGKYIGFEEKIDGDISPSIKNVWWNKKWVPFAIDGCGNLLCIDFDPSSHGIFGQIIGFERTSGPYLTDFNSFLKFLVFQLKFTIEGGLVAENGILS